LDMLLPLADWLITRPLPAGAVISTTSMGTENTGSFFSLSSRSIDDMIFSLE